MKGSNFVYDVAYELQEDLKELSQHVGEKETENLVRKVVGALEVLEWHTGRYEGRQREMSKLEEAVEKLEKEKSSRLKDREEQDQDRKKLEKFRHADSLKLMHSLESLEEDNSQLKKQIEEVRKRHKSSGSSIFTRQLSNLSKMAVSREQLEIKNVHLRLKETLDSQTEEIRHLKKELAQRCIDFDAMQQQCISLSNTNADICERLCNSKLRSKRLIEEKAFIEAKILINQKINPITQNALNEQDDVFASSTKNEEGDYYFYDYDHQEIGEHFNSSHDQPDESMTTSGIIYEPEFSWEEVCNLWKERDRLRSEIEEKEGQLRGNDSDSPAAVQGPINREPADKLRTSSSDSVSKSDTGISRFFQKILKTPKD